MKDIFFETEKGEFIAFDSTTFQMIKLKPRQLKSKTNGLMFYGQEYYKEIGKISDLIIDEKACKDIVGKGLDNSGNEAGYHDYLNDFHNVTSSTTSFISLIDYLKIPLDNSNVVVFKKIQEL